MYSFRKIGLWQMPLNLLQIQLKSLLGKIKKTYAAFDYFKHSTIILKLKYHGICGIALDFQFIRES